MQRAGGRYRAANGSRLPNLGQQLAAFRTPEGRPCSLRFQIAGVERPSSPWRSWRAPGIAWSSERAMATPCMCRVASASGSSAAVASISSACWSGVPAPVLLHSCHNPLTL